MTKSKVLELFANRTNWIFPDDVWFYFNKSVARVSVYAFLLRIWRQKLLVRTLINKRIAYSISPKGRERLKFLNNKENGYEK